MTWSNTSNIGGFYENCRVKATQEFNGEPKVRVMWKISCA